VHVIPKDQAALGDVEFLDDGPQDFFFGGNMQQAIECFGAKTRPAETHDRSSRLLFFTEKV
jgi:hypothetical protein